MQLVKQLPMTSRRSSACPVKAQRAERAFPDAPPLEKAMSLPAMAKPFITTVITLFDWIEGRSDAAFRATGAGPAIASQQVYGLTDRTSGCQQILKQQVKGREAQWIWPVSSQLFSPPLSSGSSSSF